MRYVRSIPVVDASGAGLTVYEFRDRRVLKTVRRMVLCTGELVEELDYGFIVVATGEKLARA